MEANGVAAETDGVAVGGVDDRFAPRGAGGTNGLGIADGFRGVAMPGAPGVATRGVANGFVPTAGGLLGATPIGRGLTGAAGTAVTLGTAVGEVGTATAAGASG